MTGEITLRGEVLPIGGLKEKLLAAHRGGIKTVLIPQQNVKDLTDVPENIKNYLDIYPVQWIDDVLKLALASAPVALATDAGLHDNPVKEVQLADNSKETPEATTDAIKH
jgi:ATP-dependent Lon protease